jgi:hypothetical protein
MNKDKRNDFGELVCECNHERWDHVLSEGVCIIRKCKCDQFIQAYES